MKHQSFILSLAVLICISAQAVSPPLPRSNVMDKGYWTTHCFGRFLIDLPTDAKINAGYYIWDSLIERLYISPKELNSLVNKHEQTLKSQPHDKFNSLFVQKAHTDNGAIILLSWNSEVTTSRYLQDTYFLSKSEEHIYRHKLTMAKDRESQGKVFADNLASNTHSLSLNEYPTEAGFCIDKAYISGAAYQQESFDVGVTFPNYPGALFTFHSSTGAEEDQLLDRVGGFLVGLGQTSAGIKTLRKGQRNIGPIQAQEYLIAGSEDGQRTYAFSWESQGRDRSLSEPNITAALGIVGEPPATSPFKSDQEALQLWDAIIETIRLRPGAVSGGSSSLNPNPNSLTTSSRMSVRSGTPCPWPGTWHSPEAPELGKQTFAHGVSMPQVGNQDVTWVLVQGV